MEGVAALNEECRETAKQQSALMRSDMDQIMSSRVFLESKLRGTHTRRSFRIRWKHSQIHIYPHNGKGANISPKYFHCQITALFVCFFSPVHIWTYLETYCFIQTACTWLIITTYTRMITNEVHHTVHKCSAFPLQEHLISEDGSLVKFANVANLLEHPCSLQAVSQVLACKFQLPC